MKKGTVLIYKWEDTRLSSLMAKICLRPFVYGQDLWRSFLTITHLRLWHAAQNLINPLPFFQKHFLPWFDNEIENLYVIFHLSAGTSCTAAAAAVMRSIPAAKASSPWGAADMEGCPAATLCIWIFIYSIGGRRVGGGGGCHLDLARATWLLYFQTNTRPSSVGQDLISVSLAPERGDGDKVSGWWLSWAITGVFFCSKATGDGRHVEKAKEVSTHCKSLLLIATGSSPTWHVELNLLTSILSHFFRCISWLGVLFWGFYLGILGLLCIGLAGALRRQPRVVQPTGNWASDSSRCSFQG